MPGVCRNGDATTTGHGCDTTTTVTGSSTDVFCNTKGVERKGDPTAAHTIPNEADPPVCVAHTSATITEGSSTVFVNGRAIARITDDCDAGAITEGSTTVFAG
jgi:uncharacterized Zn-binding protein involved in type VI secretion